MKATELHVFMFARLIGAVAGDQFLSHIHIITKAKLQC
jgi:hypothetical protein